MFFAEAKLAKSIHDFSGYFVYNLFILFLTLKIEVCTVVIHDGIVARHDPAAIFIQPAQVFFLVFLQYVHKSQNMLVFKFRLLIIRI